jgi:hypothetical protein
MIKRIKRNSIIAPHQFVVIPFPAIQNHFVDVSGELGWLRSNGMSAMLIGHLDSGSKRIFCRLVFEIQQLTNTSLMGDLEPMDPLPSHPKSFCGCFR